MVKLIKNISLPILGALLVASADLASAQEIERQFSAKSGELVNKTLELAKAEKFEEALNILENAIIAPDLNAYERSTMFQMMGQYLYETGRPNDAQQAFEDAIAAGGLSPEEVGNISVVIAQLKIGNGQFREGAEALEAYLASGGDRKPQYIDLLVNAWVQAEDYERALPWAEEWFEQANPKERKHFDLLNFLYNNLGQAGRQADIVRQMIDRWPDDKSLWEIWASMLANGGREQDAFEVTKIMYLKDMLTTEKELLKVVQYYSFYDMPYQAAQILKLEMEAGRISRTPEQLKQLSGLYRQAREYERAIPILEKAASLSGDSVTFAALGEALHNAGECRKSEIAFSEAIHRGFDAGKAWMLVGTCHYDRTNTLDRLNCNMTKAQRAEAPISKARDAAMAAFKKVPKRSREYGNAAKWLAFIEAEIGAAQTRCDVYQDAPKELCFVKIKQAHDAAIFTDGFKLDDTACAKYIVEYNAKYRRKDLAE